MISLLPLHDCWMIFVRLWRLLDWGGSWHPPILGNTKHSQIKEKKQKSKTSERMCLFSLVPRIASAQSWRLWSCFPETWASSYGNVPGKVAQTIILKPHHPRNFPRTPPFRSWDHINKTMFPGTFWHYSWELFHMFPGTMYRDCSS